MKSVGFMLQYSMDMNIELLTYKAFMVDILSSPHKEDSILKLRRKILQKSAYSFQWVIFFFIQKIFQQEIKIPEGNFLQLFFSPRPFFLK